MKSSLAKRIGLLGFFFFFSATLPSAVAAPGDHSAGLKVGQVWPSGEIGKSVEGSVAPGIFYEYGASDVFSVYAEGVRSSHTDGLLKVLSTTAGIKANLFYIDKLAPYALLGAGLYFVRQRFGAEEARKTNFGLHLGVGADLDISDRFFAGFAFDLHNLFASTATLPSGSRREISGRWTGFFLKGGLRF